MHEELQGLPSFVEVRPLVPAAWELLWFGRTWVVLGAIGLIADLLTGSFLDFTTVEAGGSTVLFAFAVCGALARYLLGLRTPPEMLYAQIFDRTPAPPRGAHFEPSRTTASRAVWTALGVTALLGLAAAVALVVVLLLMGRAREHVLDHLPAAAGLVAAGWTLVCGASALTVATWFTRWERRRGKVVLSRPLTSGRLSYVYYTAHRTPPAR